MSGAQWSIIGILLVIGVIDASNSPESKQIASAAISGTGTTADVQSALMTSATHVTGFLFGAFLLLWGATALPRIATSIALIVLLLTVLRYADNIGAFVQQPGVHIQQGGK